MKVETYEVTESANAAEQDQHDAASLEIIERLGLTGQKQLMTSTTNEVIACPYRLMTRDEHFVYTQLCPKHTEAKSYRAGPIPLRVLQIIAWALDNSMFKRLEIWAADSAQIKDPVLVGLKQSPENSWSTDIFILARWADELLPIEVLMPDAVKAYLQREKQRANEDIAAGNRRLLELKAYDESGGGVPRDWSM